MAYLECAMKIRHPVPDIGVCADPPTRSPVFTLLPAIQTRVDRNSCDELKRAECIRGFED